jgi:hypothetical protein
MKLIQKKIKSIKVLDEKIKTYDIQVQGTHHYILKSGIISHNSQDLFPKAIQSGGKGLDYSASTIVYLTKAKLKTGDEDELDLGASGIIVTALARKNRKAKPKKIKFEINHGSGTNRFKGLEYFCTPENFDTVGIAKVKEVVDKKTGEVSYEPGGTKWFVKSLGKSFHDRGLFNANVFTPTVLAALDPIIDKYFKYASQEEIDKIQSEMDEMYEEYEKEFEIDDVNDSELFD